MLVSIGAHPWFNEVVPGLERLSQADDFAEHVAECRELLVRAIRTSWLSDLFVGIDGTVHDYAESCDDG